MSLIRIGHRYLKNSNRFMGSKKSQTFRFAVGTSDYPLSFTWRLWVHGDEIYVGTSEGAHFYKVSLHSSGIWRVAYVHRLDTDNDSTDRVLVKWRRPPELFPGWIPSVVIHVSSIAPARPIIPMKTDDHRITWISAPSVGKKLLLRVFLSLPGIDKNSLELGPNRLFGGLATKSGVKAWVIVQEEPLTSIEIGKIEDVRSKTKFHVSGMPKLGSGFNPRAVLVVSEDEPTERSQPTLFDIMLGYENVQIEAPIQTVASASHAPEKTGSQKHWSLRLNK